MVTLNNSDENSDQIQNEFDDCMDNDFLRGEDSQSDNDDLGRPSKHKSEMTPKIVFPTDQSVGDGEQDRPLE